KHCPRRSAGRRLTLARLVRITTAPSRCRQREPWPRRRVTCRRSYRRHLSGGAYARPPLFRRGKGSDHRTSTPARLIGHAGWTDTCLDTLTGVVQAVQARTVLSGVSSVDTAWTRYDVQAASLREIGVSAGMLRAAWTRARLQDVQAEARENV